MTFNTIDAVLVVLVLLSVLNGWRRGFIVGVLDLLGWIASLLAGLRFYQPLARWLGPRVDLWPEVWDQPMAFLLIATGVGLTVHLVSYAIVNTLHEDVHERTVNKVLGLIPGLANGLITATIVAAVVLALPLNEGLRERVRGSAVVNYLAVYAERL